MATATLEVVRMDVEAPTSIERHRADSLVRDERVQRNIIDKRVRDLAANLNLDGIGVVTVSKRADAKLVILDGQHRIQALIDAGHGSYLVTCNVFHGLTVPQEAERFRVLNNTRKPTALDDYVKGLTAGDPECVAIDKILKRVGLRVTLQSGPGIISCVDAFRSVYRSKRGPGPAALGFAVSTAVAAWGVHSDSVDGHIVRGLGDIYLRYQEEIDRPSLIKKLAKFPGGPAGMIGKAKGLREMRPGAISRCVAILTVDLYNKGRRDRLPAL